LRVEVKITFFAHSIVIVEP